MPKIYKHQQPNRRVIVFARARQAEIENEIEQLQLEHELMQKILNEFEPSVCPACKGEGSVMRLIEGCECDGPRQHTCEKCNGTGKPTNNEKDK